MICSFCNAASSEALKRLNLTGLLCDDFFFKIGRVVGLQESDTIALIELKISGNEPSSYGIDFKSTFASRARLESSNQDALLPAG